LANLVEVDFHTSEVVASARPQNLEDVAAFLEADAPEAIVAAIENFLADPETEAVATPPEGGRTRGAQTNWCTCDCGAKNGCMRLSTAPGIHQPQTGECRCAHKECPCA
jgi:hypothetical protein